MSTKRRAMIISASAGSGHVRAGDALAQACAENRGIGEVLHVDALDYTTKFFRELHSSLYLHMIRNAPSVLGWYYESRDEPWKTSRIGRMMDRLNTAPLIELIRKHRPDLVVCTHFMPAAIISHLIGRKKLNTHLSIVVTDFYVHAMWLCRFFHHYFVANEESKVHLNMLGIPDDRVVVSGIPIDPVFARAKDRAELRRKYRLKPDLPVILVSAGTFGVTAVEDIIRMLKPLRAPAQVVVICGKNGALELRAREAVRAGRGRHPPFRVLGYTNRMHEWMGLSDLYIGKAGGLVTAEALASRLPMVLFEPIPGQEERNSDYLLENSSAIRCDELTTLAYKVDGLLENPSRLARMRSAMRRVARPHAAEAVIQHLLDEFHEKPVAISAATVEATQRLPAPAGAG